MRAKQFLRGPFVHRCNTPIASTRGTSKVPDVFFMDLISCHSSKVGFMSLKVVPHSSQTTRPWFFVSIGIINLSYLHIVCIVPVRTRHFSLMNDFYLMHIRFFMLHPQHTISAHSVLPRKRVERVAV